ncbi:4-(cytidine 5'-diphospho)-2-C-methyl-D-erythritol kinase [Roseibium sp.]|uniref:4-(cytidine 5'-diphospho)-2-C-methyl-D-erythritol kinase n=1 Tax=Roseibium sp. TaxID=1936156 RepID=UPI0039F0B0EE
MVQISAPSARVELARAKVNLALHVTGQRSDGYHLLESLVAFPQIGDRIAVEAASAFELVLEGPFARNLDGPSSDNLIRKAVEAFSEAAGLSVPDIRITLSKRLPVASGIGGGSSDAATTLRLLEDYTGHYFSENELHRIALSLGADVPVCLYPETQIMRGIGDELSAGPLLPRCGIVLINPRVVVSTPEIFRAMTKRDNPGLPKTPERFADLEGLTGYLQSCRNDMQPVAAELQPDIVDVISALDGDDRVQFARMSGSGATCFGLCEPKDTMDIERDIRAKHPDWWIASGPLT